MVLRPHLKRAKSSHGTPLSVGEKPGCWAPKLLLANTGQIPDTLARSCVRWGKKRRKSGKSPSSSSQPPTFSDAASSDFRLLVTFLSSSSRSPHFLPKDKGFLCLILHQAIPLKEVFKRRNRTSRGPQKECGGKNVNGFF